MVEANPFFEEAAKKGGFYTEELMKQLAGGAHLSDMNGIPTEIKKIFVTAHEISPEWHVEMQAAFQKYTDNAVSKTVNFSHEAGKDDVANVYMLAYEKNLKGHYDLPRSKPRRTTYEHRSGRPSSSGGREEA